MRATQLHWLASATISAQITATNTPRTPHVWRLVAPHDELAVYLKPKQQLPLQKGSCTRKRALHSPAAASAKTAVGAAACGYTGAQPHLKGGVMQMHVFLPRRVFSREIVPAVPSMVIQVLVPNAGCWSRGLSCRVELSSRPAQLPENRSARRGLLSGYQSYYEL